MAVPYPRSRLDEAARVVLPLPVSPSAHRRTFDRAARSLIAATSPDEICRVLAEALAEHASAALAVLRDDGEWLAVAGPGAARLRAAIDRDPTLPDALLREGGLRGGRFATPDLEPALRALVASLGATGGAAVPIVAAGATAGAAIAFARAGALGPELLGAVQHLAGLGGVAASRALGEERARRRDRAAIAALVTAADARQGAPDGHSLRVARLARAVAAALDLPPADLEAIELAALLHDVGMYAVPDQVLQRPGPLAGDDLLLVLDHCARGAELVGRWPELAALAPLVRHHHAWADGRGDPDDGVEAPPPGAAILAVADAFDAMTGDRPYRPGRSGAWAIEELRRNAGEQFDPTVVEALVRVLGERPAEPRPDDGPGSVSPAEIRGTAVARRVADLVRLVPELDAFLAAVAREVTTLSPGCRCLIALATDHGELAVRADTAGLEPAPPAGRGRRLPPASALARAVAERRPVAADGEGLPLDRGARPGAVAPASEAAVPLVGDDRVLGALALRRDRAVAAAFTDADRRALEIVAAWLSPAVRVALAHEALKRTADSDGLTLLSNHRAFYRSLEAHLDRAAAVGTPVGVVLFDVDGLKQINDDHGHLAGDALLRRVARLLEVSVRPGDIVARYGGDEFGIVMPGADAETARAVGVRVRRFLRKRSLTDGRLGPVGVTFGAAAFPADGRKAAELVAVADHRLYAARGRRPTAHPETT